MPLNVTNTADFILAEFTGGIDYWEILEGVSKILSMPEFKVKNDIWTFEDGQLKILFSDLYKIKDSVKNFILKVQQVKKLP